MNMNSILLSCGVSIDSHRIDLGMRELKCECGGMHAVVTDINPLTRFLPEFLVDSLEEIIEVVDSEKWGEFGMTHVMGLVMEDFPEEVVFFDASEDGYLGYSGLWVSIFDSWRLHEIIVELVIEIMEHAMSHSDDENAMGDFEEKMSLFDITEFVKEYRMERDLNPEDYVEEYI